MSFDLDDEELKATKEIPCNKVRYNYKLEIRKEVKKAINIINKIFIKQAEENRRFFHRWYEIDCEDTEKLMAAINILLQAYEKDEKIIDRMLDTFIGLDSDIEIVKQHARIDTQKKKETVLKNYESIIEKEKD